MTLPDEERYRSSKFRRVARFFNIYKLDPYEAVELVAFLDLIPWPTAMHIFHWGYGIKPRIETLCAHEFYQEQARPLIEANNAALSIEAGLAIIRAGGGKAREMAPFLVQTLAEIAHNDGLKAAAARSGLSRRRVQYLVGNVSGDTARLRTRPELSPTSAAAFLAVG